MSLQHFLDLMPVKWTMSIEWGMFYYQEDRRWLNTLVHLNYKKNIASAIRNYEYWCYWSSYYYNFFLFWISALAWIFQQSMHGETYNWSCQTRRFLLIISRCRTTISWIFFRFSNVDGASATLSCIKNNTSISIWIPVTYMVDVAAYPSIMAAERNIDVGEGLFIVISNVFGVWFGGYWKSRSCLGLVGVVFKVAMVGTIVLVIPKVAISDWVGP